MKLTKQKSLCAVLCLSTSLAWMALSGTARAQEFTTTTVQGTVFLANGHPGSGSLQVSWPAFTTANNQAVAAGRMNVTIGADGYVSVNLAANLGATPAGLYYTTVYHLSDGTTSTEYWVVPAAAQATLSQVRAQVMPAAQAVQAVSKAYVDQSVQELTQSLLTASGGSLSGPLFLNGDPIQPTQAASKHYVDTEFGMAVPMSGAALTGPLTSVQLGAAYQVDQFPGADFGAKLQACVNALNATYGGTCDARNFSGSLALNSNLIIGKANAIVQLPCATISTSNQIAIPAGTRNVTLHGCALRGTSSSSGSAGGTVFLYSGTGAMIQVGDPTYGIDTSGFHIDNAVINTTGSTNLTAEGLVAYRTQEINLGSLYFLGNPNQTGITLDGTGNYTGGTFQDIEIGGFGTAINAIGHQIANPMNTDWLNASTFLRLHIDCPTNGGTPVAGTYGINLVQGDGNTFTGGDVEGCSTAVHLGPNAQNNTIVGLRNENSINQVVADAGSSYNNWITGGTMFTGQLTDNGTRNSFLDTFHRSFNGLNGDWYGSQQDATVTNHFRLGTGNGNERGLLNRYQTDSGYRWTTGFSDATAGQQFYQVLDELNNVYRLSIGQYNYGQPSSNNQTVINAAGSGAVVLNGSSNSGTGGILFGSGGMSAQTVASINNAGNAQFNGTLQVGGPATFNNSTTVKNQADAEIDNLLWAGATANQKESYTYKDYTGASQWYMVKDASNNWALNSAPGGLDSFKAYQSTNSGDTYINASNGTGHIRFNYESGSGAETDIYSGSSSALVAVFLGTTAIKFPGLAASGGRNCLQIDNSGYISNTGLACGGMTGTVNTGGAGQVAYYAGNGNVIAGTNAVAVTAGGTGASSAAQALQNLGGQPAIAGLASDGASGVGVTGNVAARTAILAAGAFSSLATCASSKEGTLAAVTDSMTNTGGATITGGGSYHVNAYCNGSAWTVQGGQVAGLSSDGANGLAVAGNVTSGGLLSSTSDSPAKNAASGYADFGYLNCTNEINQYFIGAGSANWSGTHHICVDMPHIRWQAPGIDLGTTSSWGAGGWSVHTGINMGITANSPGISSGLTIGQIKAGVGDTQAAYLYNYNYGGAIAGADEGLYGIGIGAGEEGTVYTGTVATGGGGTGATALKVNCTHDCPNPGDGRYLIDMNSAVAGNATAMTAPSGSFTPGTFTTDISVTPSTFWGTLASTINTPLPATGTVGVASTSMTFVVNTGQGNTGAPAAGDLICFGGSYHEQAKITSVSGAGPWTVTAPLRHGHEASTWVMANGPCGQFIEFTANTVAASGSTPAQTLRFPIDVLGATDAHTLVWREFSLAGANSSILGNLTFAITVGGTISNTGGVVTFTGATVTNGNNAYTDYFNQPTLTISGTGTAFDTQCTNSVANASGFLTCTQSASTGLGPVSSPTVSIGATVYGNTGFLLYKGAETLDVLTYTTNPPSVSPSNVTTFTVEPNNATWANADAIEQVHHYANQSHTTHDVEVVYNPMLYAQSVRSLGASGAGIRGGNSSGSFGGFEMDYITNGQPASYYSYHGGVVTPPGGHYLEGLMNYALGMHYAPDPPGSSAFYIGCPYSGCSDASFSYNFLTLAGNGGSAQLIYTPNTRTFQWSGGFMDFVNMPIYRPTVQSVSNGQPASITLNYLDGGGASHKTIVGGNTGGNGSTVTFPVGPGTLALNTVMGASGGSHAAGLVPDPGSTSGTTHYLREDGTWQVPPGSGSGMVTNVPLNLQYLGDGSEGAYTCTSGSCSINAGEHWYSSFNVSSGATLNVSGNPSAVPIIIRSPGTCTVAGNFTMDARNTLSNWGGGGGGGGGGTAAGVAGYAAYGVNSGGTAGASSGGAGGTGTLFATTSVQHLLVGSLLLASINGGGNTPTFGGSGGGAGGSSGPAGGYGGGMIIMACGTLNITGTISASGANGAASTANNMGASGGGGGGVIILRSPALTNSGTVAVTGGAGGSCGSYTGCGAGGNGAAGWTMIISN